MRAGLVVLLSLLSAPAAADCAPTLFAVGSGLATYVANADCREIERLVGAQLDHVVCGRMRRVHKYLQGFVIKRGFFVLTKDEVLFVGDRREKTVLFRTGYGNVSKVTRSVFGFGVDNTLSLKFSAYDDRFRFELTCAGGARLVVDEFQSRTGSTGARALSGLQYSCD